MDKVDNCVTQENLERIGRMTLFNDILFRNGSSSASSRGGRVWTSWPGTRSTAWFRSRASAV